MWAAASVGIRIIVRVMPRSSRDGLDGVGALADGRDVLRVRVRAVPENGRANEAVTAVLATAFDVPRSRIALVEGATARIKVFAIAGDAVRLGASCERLMRAPD